MRIKSLMFLIICICIMVIAGCSSSPTAAGCKWLDYGNGMINLNHVSMISPNNTLGALDFDNFKLMIPESFGKTPEDQVANVQKELIKFLQGNDTYMHL